MEEPRKKRSADKQGRKEDLENEDSDGNEEPVGTWKPADQTVLVGRKIIKARRSGAQTGSEATSTLPRPIFAFSESTPTSKASEAPEGEKPKEIQVETKGSPTFEFPKSALTIPEKKEESTSQPSSEKTSEEKPSIFGLASPPADILSFKPSSFSFSTSFSFPSTSLSSLSSSSVFGQNIAPPKESGSLPSFSFSTEMAPVKPVTPTAPVEPSKTGEEDEDILFQSRSRLFILDTKGDTPTWRERGVGTLKVNVAKNGSYARILMRMDASFRLILNVSLFPTLVLEKSGDRGVLFTANALEEEGLCSYITKFRSSELAEEFMQAVEQNKTLGHNAAETTASEKKEKAEKVEEKKSEVHTQTEKSEPTETDDTKKKETPQG